MAFEFIIIRSLIFLSFSIVLLQYLQTTNAHDHIHNHLRFRSKHDANPINKSNHNPNPSQIDPELHVFFHYNDLKPGRKLQIYFPKNDPSTSPKLLSKPESDSIPFSSSHLPQILNFFNFHENSKQALAMQTTLHHCESPPIKGETKFCATSLESLLDSIREIFGRKSRFKAVTTSYVQEPGFNLQNYTVLEAPTEISSRKIVACHTLPYPYAVFYCHGQESDNLVYRVELVGELDGGRVEAVAMCHMDTSGWDYEHVAFRVLRSWPGLEPVCHFFPADNLVWIAVSS